jgi:hypothetical protein
MKLSLSSALLLSALGCLGLGCGVQVSTDEDPEDLSAEPASETTAEAPAACGAPAPECTFSRGITTCVTTTQTVESSTHVAFSGCVAFNGTTFVAGQRARTFADQILVTVTTTTLQHWHHGKVFDTSTVTTREIIASTLISDVCTPL